MALKKITKQTFNMIMSANRFLRQHNINDDRDPSFMIVEQMLRDSDVFLGYYYCDENGFATAREKSSYVQFSNR